MLTEHSNEDLREKVDALYLCQETACILNTSPPEGIEIDAYLREKLGKFLDKSWERLCRNKPKKYIMFIDSFIENILKVIEQYKQTALTILQVYTAFLGSKGRKHYHETEKTIIPPQIRILTFAMLNITNACVESVYKIIDDMIELEEK